MFTSLYHKILCWFALNLVLPGLVLAAAGWWYLFGNSDRLFSPLLFRDNINTTIGLVAANLQYKPLSQWGAVLKENSQEQELDFHLQTLDDGGAHYRDQAIPSSVLKAAARIPKPPYSLCGPATDDPDNAVPDSGMEAGIPPTPRAVYLREGYPPMYWFARTVFVPDASETLHYVVLAAASPSFSGNGRYFNIEGVLTVGVGVLGFSFLWWWPFVRNITRPLQSMTEIAERIAAGDYATLPGGSRNDGRRLTVRQDEIGRLAQAVSVMADQVRRQMHGQRRFIRYIAHELGSPLARIKLGLAVLDARLDGDAGKRIGQVIEEVEQLSTLVDEVLSYLRAASSPESPECKIVAVRPILDYVAGREARNATVVIQTDGDLAAWADVDCLRRAVANALRNAARYAGTDGPVTLEARPDGAQVLIEVRDCGPGVPEEELGHILEPFYRGSSAASFPGGTGLGLSIVKQSVEACGGSVSCRNLLPTGFCVAMRFQSPGAKTSRG